MMRIGHIEIFVRDPLRARQFYEETLGFKVTTVQADQFVWLKSGDLELLLRPAGAANRAETYQDASSALVLYTSDLSRTRKELESRGLVFKATDGSEDCLTFTDPDGNWFQLVEHEG
jgi:catechol 2,3-dioxygenase-like lactoylglutathione lyase family enzyme